MILSEHHPLYDVDRYREATSAYSLPRAHPIPPRERFVRPRDLIQVSEGTGLRWQYVVPQPLIRGS